MSRGGATKPVRVHRTRCEASLPPLLFSPLSQDRRSGERRRRDGRTRERRRGTEPGAVPHPPSPCELGSPTAAIAGEGPDPRIVVGGEAGEGPPVPSVRFAALVGCEAGGAVEADTRAHRFPHPARRCRASAERLPFAASTRLPGGFCAGIT